MPTRSPPEAGLAGDELYEIVLWSLIPLPDGLFEVHYDRSRGPMSIPRRNFPPEGVLNITPNSPVVARFLPKFPQDPVKDPAVLVVADLVGRVEPDGCLELGAIA
ncbi:MAG: hypothetical protein QOI31_1506 [Solirubrobacterales bacterium]|nr:hypothetical protein [Solirubrobacterales bacterium]